MFLDSLRKKNKYIFLDYEWRTFNKTWDFTNILDLSSKQEACSVLAIL